MHSNYNPLLKHCFGETIIKNFENTYYIGNVEVLSSNLSWGFFLILHQNIYKEHIIYNICIIYNILKDGKKSNECYNR